MRSIFSDPNASLDDIARAITALPDEESFNVMARWLGSGVRLTGLDRSARVRFTGSPASYADMTSGEVVISAVPMSDRDLDGRGIITLGAAVHEAGHLLLDKPTNAAVQAKYAKSKDKGTALFLSNLIGDRYNEWYLMSQFPGTQNPLQTMRRYMAGQQRRYWERARDTQHPAPANYPQQGLKTPGDVRNTFVLAGAYDGYVNIPGNYGWFREVRKLALFVSRHTRTICRLYPDTEAYVAAHVALVEVLLRAWKRAMKALPEPEPQPEPQPQPEQGEGEGQESQPGESWSDESEQDGEPQPGEGKGKGQPQDEQDEDADEDESESGDDEGETTDESDEDETDGEAESEADEDESEDGDESDSHGADSDEGDESDEDDTDEDGDEPGEGEGNEPESERESDVEHGDLHAPGGQRGGNKDSEAMAERLNEALRKAQDDPFVKDNDILTGEEGTGTIDRSGPKHERPYRDHLGESDADLSEAMRQAFVRSRLSHDRYTAGFQRGRLRNRDACKAPAGVDDLFSQKADRSATRVHVALLVDYSGSMSGLVRHTDTFIRSLAEATRGTNVRVSVWTYETAHLYRIWESDSESEAVLEENLTRSTPSGGTMTGVCLAMLSDEIARTRFPGERTVILSVTDGMPHDAQVVTKVVEDLRDRDGVAVAGVYIGSIGSSREAPASMVSMYGDDALPWTGDWATLGEDLMDLAGDLLSGAREV